MRPCCSNCKSNKAALIPAVMGAIVILGGSVVSTMGKDKGTGVLDRTMTTLAGDEQPLNEYLGEVVLIVNTASQCGLTPQYDGLESLYGTRKDQGFVILGFPANNFGNQEPGSDEEIAEFCELNFGVTFPMFSKISVKGDDIHPLYEQLTSMPEPIGGEVQWNFQKYVVDRSGEVVAKFGPRTAPEDPELLKLIDSLLGRSVD